MIRRIIRIDEEKCNGCGACADACHEGAIEMIDGKARLMREDYCDGLGDCLPACPAGAISFEEREAPGYNEAAVLAARAIARQREEEAPQAAFRGAAPASRLSQWPVQIKLAPINASYFNGANLRTAAECTAYAYGSFHQDFIRGRVTLIGCPKLDMVDYTEKLEQIIRENEIRSLTVVRMEVPCCGGIEHAAITALKNSGKFIPWQVVTISTDGRILER